ncbi:MAG: hypothetical protein R6X02_09190 [Enhygromyxa sp.]
MRADDVEIGRPCPIDLRERIADASAEFHCDHCDRPVHVLSHMSEEAAAQVLARRQRDNLCVAFLRAGDGRVHFREKGEVLIPASRLGGPRTLLGLDAQRRTRGRAGLHHGLLALSLAACSGEGQVEVAELEVVEQPRVTPPTTTVPSDPTQAENHAQEGHDPEQYEVLAGAPPMPDEVKQPCGPNGEPHVAFGALEPIRTPNPPQRELQTTQVAREGRPATLNLEYCVDEQGKVVDPKRLSGDKALARLFIRHMKGWRFKPHEINGRKTRVCTTQYLRVTFEDEPV